MQEAIITLIDKVILDNSKNKQTARSYDIAFLKETIQKVNSDKKYFSEYILDLNDDVLSELVSLIEPVSERKSFLASIIYIKKLISINKAQKVDIPLSENQNAILYELYELIKRVIENDEASSASSPTNDKSIVNFGRIKERLLNSELLSINDYDNLEKLILEFDTGNSGKTLNDFMTFVNNFNYNLLVSNNNNKEEKDSKEIINSLNNSDNSLNKIEDNVDIFNAQNFEYIDIKKKKGNKKNKNLNNFDYLEYLKKIGINSLNPYAEKLLSKVNKNKFIDNFDFFEQNLSNVFGTNINGLISLLCLSDRDLINELLDYFKKNRFSEEVINDLFNRATEIFFDKYKGNFIKNCELALSYNANLESLIYSNITFFYNGCEYNKNKIKILEENCININLIFKNKPVLLAMSIDKLLKNISIFKEYELEFDNDNYDSLSIMGSNNLNVMLDIFIESGFSEYIYNDTGKNIRSLILKRIFYAFKNELSIWNENITIDRLNSLYENYINDERVAINEEEISNLLSNYMILASLEDGKRATLFKDASEATIHRKYEFKFGNIIISRLKTYSVFKVLMNHKIPLTESLFYALTYNSNLEKADYLYIKKEILGK